MGASHYKGSSLANSATLNVGDFLMSPNRRFVGQLQRNGSFAIYWAPLGMGADWTPDSFEPGSCGCVWATPPSTLSDTYIMEWDGDLDNRNNLVVYHPGADKPLWQSGPHGGSGYVANLMDSGEFLLVNSVKGIGWRSYACLEPYVQGYGSRDYWGLVSRTGNYAVSCKVGGNPPRDPPVPPPAPCAAVRSFQGNGFDFDKAPDDELWEVKSWIVNSANLVAGIVFLNKATGMALGSDGAGRTRMTREVNELALWSLGPDQGSFVFALRLASDLNLHLNLAGNSYTDGTPVILWNWTGPAPNLLWKIS